MTVPAFDARLVRRLMCGAPVNGELQSVSGRFRPLAERLAGTPLDGCPAVLESFLSWQPDRETIAAALAAANPEGPAPEADPDDLGEGLATTCLADIRPEPIRWHVPGILPLGKLVILAGEGGHGKTSLTLDLTARTTRGEPSFGLDYQAPPPADVLLISCEDDYGDTVVPRLMSAGADLRRVHRVDGLAASEGRPKAFTLAHLDALEGEMKRRPDVRVVIIDPVGGYIGRANIDDNKDADLRKVLDPLAEMAARRSVLMILVKHLSKDQTRKAAQRVGGSAAYVNAARAAFMVLPDAENEGQRLFLPIKFNCGPRPQGLAFRMESLPPGEQNAVLSGMAHLEEADLQRMAAQLYRIGWQGPVSITADEALGADARSHRTTGKDEVKAAADWLRERLADGPAGSVLCASEGDRMLGRTWPPPGDKPKAAVMARVKWWRESVLKTKLDGKPRKLGMQGPWFFTLPNGTWPPSGDSIAAATKADSEVPPEEAEEAEEATIVGSEEA